MNARSRFYRSIGSVLGMLAILTLGVACGSGVSDEEFATVQQELRAAKLQAELLQADLQRNIDEVATLGSDLQGNADEVAALTSQLDEAETMNAKLESDAMETASVQSRLDQAQENLSDLGAELDAAQAQTDELESSLAAEMEASLELAQRVDEAEALQSLLSTLLAWNRKDAGAFSAGFTENGLADSVLALPKGIGVPSISLRRLLDTDVSGDESTIHAMFGLGSQRASVNFYFIKEDGSWKIEGERQLPPKTPEGTTFGDVSIDGCQLASSMTSFGAGIIALRLSNIGEQAHDLILMHLHEGADNAQEIAYVENLVPEDFATLAFAGPLSPGQYYFQCYLAGDRESGAAPAETLVGEFMVN